MIEYKGGFVFIDLDGVLANFDKEAAKYPHLHPSKACREIEGFYTNLEVYSGAVEFVNRLEAIFPNKVRFLSAAVIERENCWTEKFSWIKTHFPSFTDRLILARSKEAVGSAEDILIDDHPQWNGADKFRGHVIKFNTDNIPNEYQRIIFLLTRV